MHCLCFEGAYVMEASKVGQIVGGLTDLLVSPICQGIADIQTDLRLLSQSGQDLLEACHRGGHAAWATCGPAQPPRSHHPARKMSLHL